jgi:HEAT repeat protein
MHHWLTAAIPRMPARRSSARHRVRLRFAGVLSLAILTLVPVPARAQASPLNFFSSPAAAPDLEFANAVTALSTRPDVLDLELAVTQAELVLAVRLVDVTETKIVHGGTNVQITEQFRFEPVRVLKGIFARETLLLTGQDLGIYRFAGGSERLARGQLMLVLLGRQGPNFFNCNTAATLSQSIPRLDGKDDPLLTAVDVLIGMTRLRDRSARVELLRDGLKKASGRAAAPLLLSILRRAVLGARAAGVTDAVLPYLKSSTPSTREVAARTLGALFEADRAGQGNTRLQAAKAIVSSLESAGPDVSARVAAIDALGSLGQQSGGEPAVVAWLKAARTAPTLAETGARLRALAKLEPAEQQGDVARLYESMPLDASPDLQSAAGQALVRLDSKAAAPLISARLASKHAAGLRGEQEISLLGQLPAPLAAPELVKAWATPLSAPESLAFAQASSIVADPRLVPAVTTLLDPRQYQVRSFALEALMKIDTDESASAIWPHLDEEADLANKLRLIAFVGRHGFRDGYAQAIEHLSQAALRDQAVEALGAIGDPRAIPELRRIWQTSNDLTWNAAAILALARLGQADITPKLLDLAKVPGEPLAASALVGLGYLGSPEGLPVVLQALSSRSDELVIAAAQAAARLLKRPELKSDPIRDRLAVLLTDADASPAVRHAALAALIALNDPRLGPSLSTVARDANLEGTPLLLEVERALLRRQRTAEQKKS